MSTFLLSSNGAKCFKTYGVLLFLLLLAAQVSAQTPITFPINTGIITGSPFCAGNSGTITFTTTLSGQKTYTAELSGFDGNFATSPPAIGSLDANLGSLTGTINLTIPPLTASSGTGYLIRIDLL